VVQIWNNFTFILEIYSIRWRG